MDRVKEFLAWLKLQEKWLAITVVSAVAAVALGALFLMLYFLNVVIVGLVMLIAIVAFFFGESLINRIFNNDATNAHMQTLLQSEVNNIVYESFGGYCDSNGVPWIFLAGLRIEDSMMIVKIVITNGDSAAKNAVAKYKEKLYKDSIKALADNQNGAVYDDEI